MSLSRKASEAGSRGQSDWREKLEERSRVHATDSCHDWGHVSRVRKLALQIGAAENADLEVLEAAALLHDMAYSKDRANHERLGAALAETELARAGFPATKIRSVAHVIRNHRFSKTPSEPLSLEAKILQDSDRLDAMGAVGIARCFIWTGQHGRHGLREGVDHFHEKLLKLKEGMNTRSARSLAQDRHQTMLGFLAQLEREEK